MKNIQGDSMVLKTSLFLSFITCLFLSIAPACFSADEPETTESGFSIYIINPISKQKILPDTTINLFPTMGNSGENKVVIKACRGEFEPASFVIRSISNKSGIRIVSTDLTGPRGIIIPKTIMDVRLVKCWYQAGGASVSKGIKTYVPELLLKDDDLVKVDEINKINYLKVKQNNVEQYINITENDAIFPENVEIHDSPTLIPFNLSANINKQVWVTIRVPDAAEPGVYAGSLLLYEESKFLTNIDINLTVLPFNLEKPPVEYGIYYTPILISDTFGREFSAQYKSEEQYRNELQNMLDHGIRYPTLYQNYSDVGMLRKALDIRDSVGVPKDKIFTMAMGVNTDYSATDRLAILPSYISNWQKLLTEYNYKDFYIYGMDEATGDKLIAQRTAWQIVHNAGAKLYAACYKGSVDIVGDLLDLPVLSGAFKTDEVIKWHNLGKKVFIYGNPQVGVEDPDMYRRNYGIPLVWNGYDGAMNFAYQYAFESSKGHIWNDFSNTTVYRNHVFAYPTSDGIIDTLQWEGFREAVDDVRYLATLAKINNITDYKSIASTFSTESDLNFIRQNIIERILAKVYQSPDIIKISPTVK